MGAEPAWFYWLRVAGQAAGIILVIELLLGLIIACALMVGLWLAMRWVRINVVPLVELYGAQARNALDIAARGGDRIVNGVAQIHGRQEAIKAAFWAFILGPNGRGARSTQQTPPEWPVPEPADEAQGSEMPGGARATE